MKHLAAAVIALSITASPGIAAGQDDMSEGMDLLSQGTQLLLRGLMSEMEPAFRELEGMLQDLNAYHAPEILPNGDIIIRRRTPLPEAEEGQIDL